MKHGTNTTGMERVVTGHTEASHVGEFGRKTETPQKASQRVESWWTLPACQQDRATFYQLLRDQQEHFAKDLTPHRRGADSI
jgi:hypothetical protein